jgi:hypothetical protein
MGKEKIKISTSKKYPKNDSLYKNKEYRKLLRKYNFKMPEKYEKYKVDFKFNGPYFKLDYNVSENYVFIPATRENIKFFGGGFCDDTQEEKNCCFFVELISKEEAEEIYPTDEHLVIEKTLKVENEEAVKKILKGCIHEYLPEYVNTDGLSREVRELFEDI